jgi:hypothetical protein
MHDAVRMTASELPAELTTLFHAMLSQCLELPYPRLLTHFSGD